MPLLFALLVSLSGCARYGNLMEACLNEARSGNVEVALVRLEVSPLAESERNRLLYLLEKGELEFLAGRYPQAVETLETAELLVDELLTRSLSRESFSFLSNDTVIPYTGEDFETAYLHYVKAMAFLLQNDLEGAQVEARKIDLRLTELGDRYGESNRYRDDAFLRFLSGLIFEAAGDRNNAFIAYRKSLEAYRQFRGELGVSPPDSLWPRLISTADAMGFFAERDRYRAMAPSDFVPLPEGGLLVVVIDNGCVSVKEQVTSAFPSKEGFPVAIALPEYHRRSRGASVIRVEAEHLPTVSAETVQSLDAIARKSLEDKIGRLLAKTVARVAAKQVAARTAQKEYGPLAGLVAQVGALFTEQADLRGWTLLPRTVEMAVLPVGPGTVEVTIAADAQRIRRTAEVPKGGIAFVHARIF